MGRVRGRRGDGEPAGPNQGRRWGDRLRGAQPAGPPGDAADSLVDLFAELDHLRGTAYRQSVALRDEEARIARERAAAQADEHRRILVAVRALARQAAEDPQVAPEVVVCAARVAAAVARLEPEPLLTLTWGVPMSDNRSGGSGAAPPRSIGTVRGVSRRRGAPLPGHRAAAPPA